MVAVEYNWKPTRCGPCQLIGHIDSKCRSKSDNRPCPPISVPVGVGSKDMSMPPSPGDILNPVKGPRLAEGPLNPPEFGQLSNFDESDSEESEIPMPNGDIIPSLPNSHEAVLESLVRLPFADLAGECNEVIVSKEMAEVNALSGSRLQYSELRPAVGDLTGCGGEGAELEPCGNEVSFDHPKVAEAALIVGVHDAGSLLGTPASSSVYHVLGLYAEVDPDHTPESILRISQKYGLDCADPVGGDSTSPCAPLKVDQADSALVTPSMKLAPTKFGTDEEIVEMNHRDWKRAKARRRRESKRPHKSSGACAQY